MNKTKAIKVFGASSVKGDTCGQNRRYKAFISYSNAADGKFAPALQSALHNFAKPWYKLRSIHVFRDQTSLSATPELWPSIETALNESEYFLLLASPQAAQSYWVEREVKWWLNNRSTEKMFIVLTDGALVWNRTTNDYDWKQTTALPNSLQGQFKDEPLYVDFRWVKKEDNLSLRNSQFRSTVLGLAAPLYGKAKDELDGEDVRQRRRNVRYAWSAGIGLSMAISLAILGGREAILQHNIRQLVSHSELLENQQANLLPQSVLLATEAMKRKHTFEADQALYSSLSLLGPKPVAQRTYTNFKDIVLSPHGKYLVEVPYEGSIKIHETVSGKEIASLINLDFANRPVSSMRHISFSDDENYVSAISSLGMSAFVWEISSGREIFRTPMERGGITAAVLSADGKYLATGHTDGMVYVWKMSSGNEVLNFSHSDPPSTLKFSPDGRYLAVTSSQGVYYGPSSKSMVRLWDVVKNREIAQLQHTSSVTKFTFSPNGKYLATTSRVGQEQEEKERIGIVKLWETETGKEVRKMQHEETVNTIKFSSNSKYLLTGSSDDTARFWDVSTGEELLSINHGANADIVDFLKIGDFSYVITAGEGNVVRLWGLHEPPLEWQRLMESPNVLALAKSADGQYLTTISHDLKEDALVSSPDEFKRNVRVWSIASIQEKLRLHHENLVVATHFSPDGKYLVTFDSQVPTQKLIPKTESTDSQFEFTDLGHGNVSVWEVSTRKRLTHLKHSASLMSIDYDPTGQYVATASVDGFVRVFNALSGKEIAKLKHDGWAFNVIFSPDGRYVATSSGSPELLEGKKANSLVTIWEWRAGQKLGNLQSNNLIDALAFSPDGQFLAAGAYDGTVHILQTTDMQEVQQFQQEDQIKTLAFSPDGYYLVTGSGGAPSEDSSSWQKGTTTLWNFKDGTQTFSMGHKSWVTTVAFSPNGKYFSSLDQSGKIGIWATASGKKIASMQRNEFVPEGKVRFSPDSKYLATAFGNQAQVWEVTTGKEIARREHTLGYLWDVAFSPDGKYLATASTDTTVGLWLWRPKDIEEEACNRLPRNLTHLEWRQYVGGVFNPYHATCANLPIPND